MYKSLVSISISSTFQEFSGFMKNRGTEDENADIILTWQLQLFALVSGRDRRAEFNSEKTHICTLSM